MSTETEKGTDLVYIRNAAGLPTEQWPDERIRAVQKMCAPKAKNVNELAAFLETCKRYGLDPIQKEAWLAPMQGGELSVIVGRDGFLKIAGRDPDYQGFTANVVREGDEYSVEQKPDGDVDIHHVKSGMDSGEIKGAYALVHRKGKKPVFYEARWDELSHLHGRDVWKKHPSQMIITRALTFALKLAYSISGVYSPADVDDEGAPSGPPPPKLEDLNARVKAKAGANGGGEPEPEPEENVVEAEVVVEEDAGDEGPDHEVVEDDAGSAEATQGGTEADASGNGPPAGPDDQEESEEEAEEEPERDQEEQVGTRTGKPRSELNKAYFATLSEKAPELYESPAQRKLWQEQKVGKPSCKKWEADDFELALLLLERGQTDVVVPEPTDGSVPV